MNKDKIDRNLIGSIPEESPSKGFVDNVMEQVEIAKETQAYRPVIAVPIQYGLVAVVVLFILASIVFTDVNAESDGLFVDLLGNWNQFQIFQSPLFSLGLLSLFFLLFFEKWFVAFLKSEN